jgi:hypothetical protein
VTTQSTSIQISLLPQKVVPCTEVGCLLLSSAADAGDFCPELRGILEAGAPLSPEQIALLPLCATCTLEGFFFDETLKTYGFPQSLHSQAHIRLGRDLKDVTTSPNDGKFLLPLK